MKPGTVFFGILTAGLLGAMVFGQTRSDPTAFEVADVHVSPRSDDPAARAVGGFLRARRFELRDASMVDLIRYAWNVDATAVAGGPGWLERDRFDIIAMAPANAPADVLRAMVRTLLADRFQLKVHEDTRPLPAYVLSLDKHKSGFTPTEGAPHVKGCQNSPPDTPAVNMSFVCTGMPMASFVQFLRRVGGDYLGSTALLKDETGLDGEWDFGIRWTGRTALPGSGSDGISLFDALEKQLGLKLESKSVAMPVILVDNVNRTPAANPPDVAQKLPARPLEFDAVSIRPSPPDAKASFAIQPGRIIARAVSLRDLIAFAWSVDVDPDQLLLGPKWLVEKRFDFVATTPADARNISNEDLRVMARTVLSDRFRIVTHEEHKAVAVYALTAPAPKLGKADDATRSSCREVGVRPQSTGRMSAALKVYACQNMDMDYFARSLKVLGPSYINRPVIDETGLSGGWDFTLSFSASIPLETGNNKSGDASPADPNGAVSLSEALKRQLGLKLQLQKHTMPVIVVDRAEQSPVNN